jgi:hypothetical protein
MFTIFANLALSWFNATDFTTCVFRSEVMLVNDYLATVPSEVVLFVLILTELTQEPLSSEVHVCEPRILRSKKISTSIVVFNKKIPLLIEL